MFLDRHINLRITEQQYNEIKEVLEKEPDTYNNVAHYIRCAIIKSLREK
jgi:Arc/MetJ-type ribon-helix-helix transcriptional regulator